MEVDVCMYGIWSNSSKSGMQEMYDGNKSSIEPATTFSLCIDVGNCVCPRSAKCWDSSSIKFLRSCSSHGKYTTSSGLTERDAHALFVPMAGTCSCTSPSTSPVLSSSYCSGGVTSLTAVQTVRWVAAWVRCS